MSDTPTRVTRGAAGGASSGRINYNQTQIINSPATFTPPLQSRNSQPNVPSRLRHNTGTPQPTASNASGSPHPSSRFPDPYPPGYQPTSATPSGQPQFTRYPERPQAQAKYTSYASRIRTGLNGVMQPSHIPGGPNRAFTPSSSSSVFNATKPASNSGMMTPLGDYGRGRRTRRQRVNYAEVEDDDFGDEDGNKSGDAQLNARRATDGARGQEGWSLSGERTPANRTRPRTGPSSTAHLPFVPEDDLQREAQKPVLLAPIRIELDTETQRIRDYFTWNVNETLITPEEFATTLCRDLDLPVMQYREPIATMIRQQTEEYAELLSIDMMDEMENDADVQDAVAEEENMDADEEKVDKENGETEKEEQEEQEEEQEKVETGMEADARVIINLDVQILTYNLRDRIEWDLSSQLTPEQFSDAYCSELGLPGEARPIIAHAIHEELLKHKKDAYEARVYGPGALQMEERRHAPIKLNEVRRDGYEKEEFGPVMVPLSMDELIQKEQERERAARRMRRDISRFQNPTGRRTRW